MTVACIEEVGDIEDFDGVAADEDTRPAKPSFLGRHSKPVLISNDAPVSYGPESSLASVPGTQSVWIKTFGCSHNISDSEYMAGQLQDYGYR